VKAAPASKSGAKRSRICFKALTGTGLSASGRVEELVRRGRRWGWRRRRGRRRRIAFVLIGWKTGRGTGFGYSGPVRRIQGGLVKRIGGGSHSALQQGSFIDHLARERLVLVHADVFARTQYSRIPGFQNVLDRDRALFVDYQSGGILIFDFDVEDGAANGYNSRGSSDLVIVRQAARMFDLHPDFAQPDFEEVSPVSSVGAKNDVRFGENLKFAAIRDLEDSITIGPCHDHLFRLDEVAEIQSPGGAVPHDGNLPGE
jgi:hypothetical protein